MVERNQSYKPMEDKRQLDVFGTPMPIKSPINFERHMES